LGELGEILEKNLGHFFLKFFGPNFFSNILPNSPNNPIHRQTTLTLTVFLRWVVFEHLKHSTHKTQVLADWVVM
jgi:hypothetical protein